MRVRPASTADIHELMAIERLCFDETLRYSGDDFMNEIAQGRIIVAESEYAGVVGYLSASVRYGLGFIDSVAVSPRFRKEGIGSSLLSHFLVTMAVYCRCVELNCDVGYLPGFYARHGFEVCGFFSTDVGDRQKHRVRMRWTRVAKDG